LFDVSDRRTTARSSRRCPGTLTDEVVYEAQRPKTIKRKYHRNLARKESGQSADAVYDFLNDDNNSDNRPHGMVRNRDCRAVGRTKTAQFKPVSHSSVCAEWTARNGNKRASVVGKTAAHSLFTINKTNEIPVE